MTTTPARYYCCDRRRLEVVKLNGTLNGLEYLEVYDSGVDGDPNRQLTLIVKFLRAKDLDQLAKEQIRIDGGERIKTVDIEWIATANTDPLPTSPSTTNPPSRAELIDGLDPGTLDQFLLVRTLYYGDFSLYTLHIVDKGDPTAPPAGFDPRLSEIQFSFKVQCPTNFDCADSTPCPQPPASNPRLDYLAKDYASFRRLMLDRISTLMPAWQDQRAADIGVTLVEMLAYVGDQLSYQQDAVATEAYLDTARLRTSLRRHARLVDYAVHDGCNARVFVHLTVNTDSVKLPRGTQLLTRVAGVAPRIPTASDQLQRALTQNPLVFETVEDALLYKDHEQFSFYTWGDQDCCLPKGTTRATLAGKHPNLKAGDVLIFEEQYGPRTGTREDADHTHRWAVLLTDVRPGSDPSGGLFKDPPDKKAVDVTEIQWADEDALPFPLCLSTRTDADHGEVFIPEVSVALGNIVLADHGMTIEDEDLGTVPEARIPLVLINDKLSCERPPLQNIPPRFRPRLSKGPLTQALPVTGEPLFSFSNTTAIENALNAHDYSSALHNTMEGHGVVLTGGPVVVQGGDDLWSISDGVDAYRLKLSPDGIQVSALDGPAAQLASADPRRAIPSIHLSDSVDNFQLKDKWSPQRDLLASSATITEFVVECEYDDSAYIRFGDDDHGMRPNSGTAFKASYRVGNGTVGNIGMESIAHIVSDDGSLASASNPLPARGGTEAEGAAAIRRDAPEAFRIQERAVTEADYAWVTELHPGVQRAAATFRWTGSWYTVFITVDRVGGGEVDNAYKQIIRDHVERYRMAGYDLEVDGPLYVPLKVAMTVCVKPDYFRADVRAALMRVFSRGWLPDGSPAMFHPDNFSFAQPVYLSRLYEAAQEVQGVESVVIDTFERLRQPDLRPLEDGVLPIDRLEIAQLDNDPNYPERGVFTLKLGGGK